MKLHVKYDEYAGSMSRFNGRRDAAGGTGYLCPSEEQRFAY